MDMVEMVVTEMEMLVFKDKFNLKDKISEQQMDLLKMSELELYILELLQESHQMFGIMLQELL